jgi:hypothetical protein
MNYVTPNMKTLVIHITYRCNGVCENCSNLCAQAPSREDMSIESIQKFINDSVILNYKWEKIVLQGGEPTLHPQFENVCILLEEYKKEHNPNVILSVCTNGYSDHTKKMLIFAEQHSHILENSFKSKEVMNKSYVYEYIPVNVAPVDIGYELQIMGCFQSSTCGITLNNQGFWECSPSAAACRVFDFYKPICNELKDLTIEATKKIFEQHCKYCGFALPAPRVKGQRTSPIWEKYFENYNNRRKNESDK